MARMFSMCGVWEPNFQEVIFFMIMMGIFSVNNSTLIRVVAEALLICQLTIIPVIFGWSPITSNGNWIKCGRELSMEYSETKIDLDKLKFSIVL